MNIMSNEIKYNNSIAFHPGSYVEDIIRERNITESEFAEQLGVSSRTISKIIDGKEDISEDVANKLAEFTGVSLKTWLNLQKNYDIKLMEIRTQNDNFDYSKKD